MGGKLHLYTGTGKGKTTAAMGLALRSLGYGRRVLLAQFMKDGKSGELRALERFETLRIVRGEPVEKFTFEMTQEEREATAKAQTAFAKMVVQAISAFEPQLTVLDELALAAGLGMLDERAARMLVETARSRGECAVTGQFAPAWLADQADYVSDIRAVRHPYETQGLSAREGIEY